MMNNQCLSTYVLSHLPQVRFEPVHVRTCTCTQCYSDYLYSHVCVELHKNQLRGFDDVIKVLISEGNDRAFLQT